MNEELFKQQVKETLPDKELSEKELISLIKDNINVDTVFPWKYALAFPLLILVLLLIVAGIKLQAS
jgi:hypothetical protein